MRALATAAVLLGAVVVASPANAARLTIEYSCRGEVPGIQVAARGESKVHPRLLQARVRHAVFSGRCKIVRYRAPRASRYAYRAPTPRKTTVAYVPTARTVQSVRVSYVNHYHGNGRFPGPPLFQPVR